MIRNFTPTCYRFFTCPIFLLACVVKYCNNNKLLHPVVHINPHVYINPESKLPTNFVFLKGKNSVRSGLVINGERYIICWLCSSRKRKMTAINIISVGVNCPELTPPKASWQTEGAEETHDSLSGLGCEYLHNMDPATSPHCYQSWSLLL